MDITAELESIPPFEPIKPNGEHHRGNQPGRRGAYSQAVALQDAIFQKAQNPKETAVGLSSLARAWSELEDRKRILRGVPLPGQLRPDLDPAQALKMLKRLRSRQPVEMPGVSASICEGPAGEAAPVDADASSGVTAGAEAAAPIEKPFKVTEQPSGPRPMKRKRPSDLAREANQQAKATTETAPIDQPAQSVNDNDNEQGDAPAEA